MHESPSSPSEPHSVRRREFVLVRAYLRRLRHGVPPGADLRAIWDGFFASQDRSIRRIAARMGFQPSELDDASQETWIHLIRIIPDHHHDFDRAEFSAWFHTCVRRQLLNIRSSTRYRRGEGGSSFPGIHLFPETSPGPLETAIREEGEACMTRLLDDLGRILPPRQAQAARMRWQQQLSTADVASSLGCSRDDVKNLLRNARSRVVPLLCESA